MSGRRWLEPGMRSVRGAFRVAARRALGPRGELTVHRTYHRLLRAISHFEPPESPELLALLKGTAAEASTFLDIGANVGRYATFLRRHSSPNALLYAIEPNPYAFSLLQANLKSRSNVCCLQIALGDRDGKAFLSVPVDPSGNPISALGHITEQASPGEACFEIELRRLDSLVGEGLVNPTPPVFVKADIEGGESAFMSGAARFFTDYRPIFYFECERAHLERQGLGAQAIWHFLSELDYTVLAPGPVLTPCETILLGTSNYLAVPWKVVGAGVEYQVLSSQLKDLLVAEPRRRADRRETEASAAHARR